MTEQEVRDLIRSEIEAARTEWREALSLEMKYDHYDGYVRVALSDGDGEITYDSMYLPTGRDQ